MTTTALHLHESQPQGWSKVWVSNGRLVSHTIDEPDIKAAIRARHAELRKDPEALKAYYVERGVLTQGGKLTKRYGG